jgi:hypothetical protein
MPPAQNSS